MFSLRPYSVDAGSDANRISFHKAVVSMTFCQPVPHFVCPRHTFSVYLLLPLPAYVHFSYWSTLILANPPRNRPLAAVLTLLICPGVPTLDMIAWSPFWPIFKVLIVVHLTIRLYLISWLMPASWRWRALSSRPHEKISPVHESIRRKPAGIL